MYSLMFNEFRLASQFVSILLVFLTQLLSSNLAMAEAAADIAPTSFYSNFSDAAYVDQDNHSFLISNLKGKVTLFNFIYTHCSNACPVQTHNLTEVQKELLSYTRKHVEFISVSLDPLNDTPKSLKAFGKKNGVDFKGWTFITGKPQDIAKLSERLQLFGDEKRAKDAKRPDDHSTVLWMIDANGRLMQRYMGNPMDIQRLSRELTQLSQMQW